jgi:hypothetical protein
MLDPNNYDANGNLKNPMLQQMAQQAMQAQAQQTANSQSGVGVLEQYRPQNGYLSGGQFAEQAKLNGREAQLDNRELRVGEKLDRLNPFSESGYMNERDYAERYAPDGTLRSTGQRPQGVLDGAMDSVRGALDGRQMPALMYGGSGVGGQTNNVAEEQPAAQPNTHTMPDGTVMEGATHEEYEQANPPTDPVLDPVETARKPAPIVERPFNKNGILQNIGEAISENDGTGSATNNSRSNTATAEEIRAKKLADSRRNEMLIRVGGAIAGGARQGGLAAMSAGAQEYGAIQDQNRLNQMSMLSKLQGMNKPTAQQEKQLAADKELFLSTNAMSTRQSFLAKRLAQEGDNVTGFFDGTVKSLYDNAVGNPRSELRLQLEAEAVNAALVSVAQTKGAISNREMELFLSPIPRVGKNQESTWIAWLEMQSALNAIKAKRLDPSNLNPDGSLKSRIQADAEASAELEQLYQNLLDTGYKRGGGQSEPNEADSVADKYL